MNVKVSGCPNGCGRHHLASIGFQGAAIKGVDGDQVPAYEVYIGGRYKDGEFRYAKRITQKIPAKRLPEAITRVVGFYEGKREQDETFDDFVDRIGHSAFEPLLSDLRGVGPVAENLALYEDWERIGLYKLERGEGGVRRIGRHPVILRATKPNSANNRSSRACRGVGGSFSR